MFYILMTQLDDPCFTEAERVGPRRLGTAPKCIACGRYIGMRPWMPPYRICLKVYGDGLGDLAGAHLGLADIFVSSKLRQCCDAAGMSGIDFAPAQVVRVQLNGSRGHLSLPETYHHATIARGRAALDVERSDAQFPFVDCQECRSMRQLIRAKRIILEEGTWDGLDVFEARGLAGKIIVSDRFAEMCERQKLKNVHLVDAAGYSFDEMPWVL
jgi:hypothetical protein